MSDPQGNVLDDQLFYPWGGAWMNGGSQYDLHFAGFQQIGDVGLHPTPTRLYSDTIGRWLTPDPAGKRSGLITNPQTWNQYAYALNNPLRLVDPSGKFPTDSHIQWMTGALTNFGFSQATAAAFSASLNNVVDKSFFFADNLHAMSGDAAFYSTRTQLLHVAADGSLTASERVVALGLGMHLAEDRLAHIGLTGMLQHFFRFHFGDANPKSNLGDLAQDATAKFIGDFKALLVKNLGEKGAEAAIGQLENAASQLSTAGVFANVRDITISLQDGEGTPGIQAPGSPSAASREDAQRQCAMGNLAACD